MKRRLALLACCAVLTTACSHKEASKPAAGTTPLTSGIDLQYIDNKVPAQKDFYVHVNGKWLDTVEIPSDKPAYGAFYKLGDETQKQLKQLIDAAVKTPPKDDPDARKVIDFYDSFMARDQIDKLGVKPLQSELNAIAALKDRDALPALLAQLQQIGVTVPFMFSIQQDAKDSTKYIVEFDQDGLGLPDRDYYLKDDPKFQDDRKKYQAHVEKMLALAGDGQAKDNAGKIMAFETELAKVQWTRVEARDADKIYNPIPVDKLASLAPGYDWKSYLRATGVPSIPYVVVSEPSYLTGFAKVVDHTPLPVLKAYLEWHLVSDYASFLGKDFVDAHFAFYGRTLQGTPQMEPRWKRALRAINGNIGFALGKMYVAKYFPPENKARMEALVGNLRAAYKASIQKLDWMDETTKKRALEKLAKFTPKVAYPDKWRDYSKLTIKPDDLVGNVMRASRFEYQRDLDKLGKPIDRNEWEMTPQTVNAYYNPAMNEIVFPSAILQPPFFNAKADDAVNYGAIGAVIGHEMSHGFDDQGAKYDGDGNLDNWWSPETLKKFQAKTKALIAQYDQFEALPGHHVNGSLTIGENIADNSGLNIAYQAYQRSLDGKPAPVIDGLTGDQRFFMGWAQVWRAKLRDAYILQLLTVDPHSPPHFRCDGVLSNMDPFYKAFDVKPGDKMYLAPDKRVKMY